jgi:hypothetical protein
MRFYILYDISISMSKHCSIGDIVTTEDKNDSKYIRVILSLTVKQKQALDDLHSRNYNRSALLRKFVEEGLQKMKVGTHGG